MYLAPGSRTTRGYPSQLASASVDPRVCHTSACDETGRALPALTSTHAASSLAIPGIAVLVTPAGESPNAGAGGTIGSACGKEREEAAGSIRRGARDAVRRLGRRSSLRTARNAGTGRRDTRGKGLTGGCNTTDDPERSGDSGKAGAGTRVACSRAGTPALTTSYNECTTAPNSRWSDLSWLPVWGIARVSPPQHMWVATAFALLGVIASAFAMSSANTGPECRLRAVSAQRQSARRTGWLTVARSVAHRKSLSVDGNTDVLHRSSSKPTTWWAKEGSSRYRDLRSKRFHQSCGRGGCGWRGCQFNVSMESLLCVCPCWSRGEAR